MSSHDLLISRRELIKKAALMSGCLVGGVILSAVDTNAALADIEADCDTSVASRFAGMTFQEVAAVALVEEDGYWGLVTTAALNLYFATGNNTGYVVNQYYPNVSQNPGLTSGWNCNDSLEGDPMLRLMQGTLGVTTDGLIGPETIRALQVRMGTYVDGVLSGPSTCIRTMQQRLNSGWF